MKEDLLHHVWKFSNFSSPVQYATSGEKVEILHPGLHNHDSGPDFFNARVRIDDIEWAGNVEIHVKSSDWVLHGHSSDRAYDSVILHVVYEDDQPESLKYASFPTIVLKEHIAPSFLRNYEALNRTQMFIPCEGVLIHGVKHKELINSYIHRLYIEKLELKYTFICQLLKANNYDWEETFYHLLARSFGLGKNRLPFELLVRSLPLSVVRQVKGSIENLEALFFGQAGFLSLDSEDDYLERLKRRYGVLQEKFSLEPIEAHLWKFSRLRPGNFPTLRIAQFVALYHKGILKFRNFIEAEELNFFYKTFDLQASSYWGVHSKFGRRIHKHSTRLGSATIDSILINAVIPIMFTYGRVSNRIEIEERAIDLINEIKGEKNSVIKKWRDLGFRIDSALESQGLLHLKKEYCDHKKCLSCTIGTTILGKSE